MPKKIARCADIPEGKGVVANLEDGREIAIYKLNGEFYALDNRCPHMEGPLGEGEVEDCMVTCPWHGWQFDIKTGTCQNMPGDDAKKVNITVQDGYVCLD